MRLLPDRLSGGVTPFAPPEGYALCVTADIHTFEITKAADKTAHSRHSKLFGANSLLSTTRAAAQNNPVCTNTVIKNPAATAENVVFPDSVNGDRLCGDDLMDSLSGQPVDVGDLLKATPRSTLLKDSLVPLVLRLRARLQRTPLPSGDQAQSLDPLIGEEALPVPLPHVTNPRTKFDFLPIEDLDVDSRDVRVAFSVHELRQSGDVHDESVAIVHVNYNSCGEIQLLQRKQNVRLSPRYGGGKGRL